MKPSNSRSNLNPVDLRRHILNMAFKGGSVHVGCAFSVVEIFSTLYNDILKINPDNPADATRDYLILSKGHGVMAHYACYRELGWLKQENLDSYFSDGSLLHGLCEHKIPGFEVSSGSLGHGLPVAVGMALGLKLSGKKDQKVYCIVGDGEMNEGTMWEALLFAGHHKLDNLIVIVDANGFQAMGEIKEVLDLEPFAAKFASFGFETFECDGHDSNVLKKGFNQFSAAAGSGKPKAMIARTVKGKGVSFMEGNNQWHYLRLSSETLKSALAELDAAGSL